VELIYTAFDLWASDFIEDMVPPLDNYISRNTETFLSGPYLDMIVNMYKKLVGTHDSDERDAGQATELIESVLHNCRGRVDRVIPEVISVTVSRLANSCEEKEFKVLLIEVIANALYYNPGLTLQILEAQGLTTTVFSIWLQAIPLFKRQFDIKLIALGLSSVFELRLASLPPLIQHGAKQILEALVKLLKKSEELRKEYELQKLDHEHEKAVMDKEEKEKANGASTTVGGGGEGADGAEDSDEEVDMQEIADDQDAEALDSDDDDDLEMSMLQSSYKQILNGEDGRPVIDLNDSSESEAEVEGEEQGEEGEEEYEEEDEEEEDDEEEYDSDSDDEEYITPIDRVDELVYFAGRIHAMFNNEGQTFQGLIGLLSPEDQKDVQSLVELAKTREQENIKKEQERLAKVAAKQ